MSDELIEGEDFVMENGLMVLTARYLLKRGHCCENDCRNCPYKENLGEREKPVSLAKHLKKEPK